MWAAQRTQSRATGLSSRWHYRRDMAQLNGSLANAAHKRARSQERSRSQSQQGLGSQHYPSPPPCAAGALQSVSQQAMKLKFIDIVKIILTGIARERRGGGREGDRDPSRTRSKDTLAPLCSPSLSPSLPLVITFAACSFIYIHIFHFIGSNDNNNQPR